MSTHAPERVERVEMSWRDYENLPEGVHGEYVDGALVMTPAPSRQHQDICIRMVNALQRAIGDELGVTTGWGWKPAADEFVPDVMVYPATEEMTRFTGTPTLVVEVLSDNRSDDLVTKSSKYAAAGLPHYWVVDPRGHVFHSYVLTDGTYRHTGSHDSGRPRLSFEGMDVSIDVDALFQVK